MIRFDGNSILIADPDLAYARQLAESLTFQGANCSVCANLSDAKTLLKSYDFDLIISNYYLSDGIIHQLIDWCAEHLRALPIFTCIGHPFPGDFKITHKHSIVALFSKNDPRRIFSGLSTLLFDFKQFHQSLLEVTCPNEIVFQVKLSEQMHYACPIEVSSEGLVLHMDVRVAPGTFAVLKFSLDDEDRQVNFTVPGFFEGPEQGGDVFRINKSYMSNWSEFLDYLNTKQITVTNFLKKASGF